MPPDNPRDAGMTLRWTVPFPGRLISKSNDKSRHLPAKYCIYEDSIARLAVGICKRPMLKMGWVILRPHFKNKIHIDLNNAFKSGMDALVKAKVFTDDKIIPCTVTQATYGDEYTVCEIWA